MNEKYKKLKQRVEKLAFLTPKKDENSVRNYLFLTGKAHELLKKFVYAREMDMIDDIELDYFEKEVEDLEAKANKII